MPTKDEIEEIIIDKIRTNEKKRNYLLKCEYDFIKENSLPYERYAELEKEAITKYIKAVEDGIFSEIEYNYISLYRINANEFELRLSMKENSYQSDILGFPLEMLYDYEKFKKENLMVE